MRHKCNKSQWTVKMRSRLSDMCQADMYIPWSMHGPNIVTVWHVVIQKCTGARKCDNVSGPWKRGQGHMTCVRLTGTSPDECNNQIVAVWCVVIQIWTWARKCDANLMKHSRDCTSPCFPKVVMHYFRDFLNPKWDWNAESNIDSVNY